MRFLIFIRNEKVVGSSPTRGSKAKTKKFSQLTNWLSFFTLLNIVK